MNKIVRLKGNKTIRVKTLFLSIFLTHFFFFVAHMIIFWPASGYMWYVLLQSLLEASDGPGIISMLTTLPIVLFMLGFSPWFMVPLLLLGHEIQTWYDMALILLMMFTPILFWYFIIDVFDHKDRS